MHSTRFSDQEARFFKPVFPIFMVKIPFVPACQLLNPHYSWSFYYVGGSGHVYYVALLRVPRRTVEYVSGALRSLHIYTWREAPSATPVCAASLRTLMNNAD
jgi:hypothetical protein